MIIKLWPSTVGRELTVVEPQTPAPDDQTPLDPAVAGAERPVQSAVQDAMQDAVHALADVALAPMEEVLGRAVWLRWALLCHLMATVATTAIALVEHFADWQVYTWTGVLTAILVANFMRWGPSAGWIHRGWTTLAALLVVAVWLAVLYDRARAGVFERARLDPQTVQADTSPWFWLPVALLVLCACLLTAHGILAPRYRLKRVHHTVATAKGH